MPDRRARPVRRATAQAAAGHQDVLDGAQVAVVRDEPVVPLVQRLLRDFFQAGEEAVAQLGERYGLEMQSETVPELVERFGVRIGEPLSWGWTPRPLT